MTDMEMKDKDTIKKRDIVLAAVLLILGITGVLIVKYGLKSGNTADVYIDDKLVQTIDMSVDFRQIRAVTRLRSGMVRSA